MECAPNLKSSMLQRGAGQRSHQMVKGEKELHARVHAYIQNPHAHFLWCTYMVHACTSDFSFSLSHTHTSTDQSILLQVCPHAGAIPTSHENMVGEEVDAWQRTGELAGAGLVVVADIGHNIIEF